MGGRLSDHFLSALDERHRTEAAGMTDLEERLAEAIDRARAAWIDFRIDDGPFTKDMAARLSRSSTSSTAWLGHLHPEDLYLACACSRRIGQAIACFERTYAPDVERIVRRFAKTAPAIDDMKQLLRRKLFVSEPDAESGIAAYSGHGFLQNWVRVTCTRTLIDAIRCGFDNSAEIPSEASVIEGVPQPGADPALDFLKRQNSAAFKAAFAEAMERLDGSERTLLKQHLISGLSIDQIAALYHVHRATAARRIGKARENLLHATRSALMTRLKMSSKEVDSLLAQLDSRLELSMSRLLGA
jgi:RNA polymerase sigma-70 factor, ECF subfamily